VHALIVGRRFPGPTRWAPHRFSATSNLGSPAPSSALPPAPSCDRSSSDSSIRPLAATTSPRPAPGWPPDGPRMAPGWPPDGPRMAPGSPPDRLGHRHGPRLRPPRRSETSDRLSNRRAQPDTRPVALDFPGSIPYPASVAASPVSGRAASTLAKNRLQ